MTFRDVFMKHKFHSKLAMDWKGKNMSSSRTVIVEEIGIDFKIHE